MKGSFLIMFLNCHVFGEAVLRGSLKKRNLYVEGAYTPHREGVTTIVIETFVAKRGEFITK